MKVLIFLLLVTSIITILRCDTTINFNFSNMIPETPCCNNNNNNKTNNNSAPTPPAAAEVVTYVLVAVSGTLQDGFPLRGNLDYHDNTTGEVVNATFIGWGLIRGLKSYFDIKVPPAREYVPPPGLAKINPAMVATGDRLDANIYAIYLVDSRQDLTALLAEPRYLGMDPDLVKVDLTANETSANLTQFVLQLISETPNVTNTEEAGVFTVVSSYKGPSFVENPVLYTKADGTRVTNFQDGLALWAGTSDSLRNTPAWQNAIQTKIATLIAAGAPPDPLYGVDNVTLRLNSEFTSDQFNGIAARAGLNFHVSP